MKLRGSGFVFSCEFSEWVNGEVCEREWERTTKRESGITRGWMDAVGVCFCLSMGEM